MTFNIQHSFIQNLCRLILALLNAIALKKKDHEPKVKKNNTKMKQKGLQSTTITNAKLKEQNGEQNYFESYVY